MILSVAIEELRVLLRNKNELQRIGRDIDYDDRKRTEVLRNFIDAQEKDESTTQVSKTDSPCEASSEIPF